jgi:hypothetical protein
MVKPVFPAFCRDLFQFVPLGSFYIFFFPLPTARLLPTSFYACCAVYGCMYHHVCFVVCTL